MHLKNYLYIRNIINKNKNLIIMKKVLAIAVLGVFVLASCKKDYSCACVYDGYTHNYELGKIKKKDAKDACNTIGASWVSAGGSCTATAK